jgi:ketosteroid isomerase-like protein
MASNARTIEQRLQELEDRQAIYQVVCGYGYAVDGCNAPAVGSFYAEDGVYALGDAGRFEGRAAVEAITRWDTHLKLVHGGCAHMSTLPYVVIDGDHAVATCHTMVAMRGADGFFIGRLSASRVELARQPQGDWKITLRQNYLQDGSPDGPALLARLQDGTTAASRADNARPRC